MFFQPNMTAPAFINVQYYPLAYENNICYFQAPITSPMDFSHLQHLNYSQEISQRCQALSSEVAKIEADSQKETLKAYSEVNSEQSENVKMEQDDQEISDENEQMQLNAPQKKKYKYGKKNSESNLVNQVFSYMVKEKKSKRIVAKLLGDNKQRIKIFYIFINKIKRINQKYMNKYYLGLLGSMDETSPIYQEFTSSVKRLKKLSFEEFKKVIRVLINSYFSSGQGLLTILQSKKICCQTKKEHIIKLRELNQYFNEEMRIESQKKKE